MQLVISDFPFTAHGLHFLKSSGEQEVRECGGERIIK